MGATCTQLFMVRYFFLNWLARNCLIWHKTAVTEGFLPEEKRNFISCLTCLELKRTSRPLLGNLWYLLGLLCYQKHGILQSFLKPKKLHASLLGYLKKNTVELLNQLHLNQRYWHNFQDLDSLSKNWIYCPLAQWPTAVA